MTEPKRLDFLVYYRNQLQTIVEKLEREIEKAQVLMKESGIEDGEVVKDLTDPDFLKNYLARPDLINAFYECRDLLKDNSDEEELKSERLYYSSKKLNKRFAMLAVSENRINIYFAPRLGLYEKLPENLWQELRFGKSQGDRWDKFVLTTHFQARKACSFLKEFLVAGGDYGDEKRPS